MGRPDLLVAGEGGGTLREQPRQQAECCGPWRWGVEGSTLAEVLYKNLVKATPCSVKRVLSFPPAATESVLREKKTTKHYFKPLEASFFWNKVYLPSYGWYMQSWCPLKVESCIKGQRWEKRISCSSLCLWTYFRGTLGSWTLILLWPCYSFPWYPHSWTSWMAQTV